MDTLASKQLGTRKDLLSMVSASWKTAKENGNMKTVRALDYLEAIRRNLLYSRFKIFDCPEWIEGATKNWSALTDQQKTDFWTEYDHHDGNFTTCHIKHEGLTQEDMVLFGKIQHKWFPHEVRTKLE